MLSVVTLCAVAFTSLEPPPSSLIALYREALGCPMSAGPSASRSDWVPLTEMPKYFPQPALVFPIVDAESAEAASDVARWHSHGVEPGMLLPSKLERAMTDTEFLTKLRVTARAGAVLIAPLPKSSPEVLERRRDFWCLRGLCPGLFYLGAGLDDSLERLPPGMYLTAPHWRGHPQWPLPPRLLEFQGRQVLSLWPEIPEGGGTLAALRADGAITVFTPNVALRFQRLGADYTVDARGLHSDVWGQLLLALGETAVASWLTFSRLIAASIRGLGAGLGWAALLLALFNVGLISFSLFWRRTARGGGRPTA